MRIFYDQYLELLAKKCSEIKIGDPLDYETRMGALVSEEQLNKVDSYVEGERLQTALRSITAGNGIRKGSARVGPFYMPTIVTGVSADSRICQEEVFGPVLSVLKYKNHRRSNRNCKQYLPSGWAPISSRKI